jgi:hypothetical protein
LAIGEFVTHVALDAIDKGRNRPRFATMYIVDDFTCGDAWGVFMGLSIADNNVEHGHNYPSYGPYGAE